jgi:dTDP-4-dehydrorhamnose 3,5-epimerase
MVFTETRVKGAFFVDLDRIEDERGFFARSWCHREFQMQGLNPCIAQCNVSRNRLAGTLRGIHFQAHPHEEAKLVRCTKGAIYDVVVDLRNGSETFLQHDGVVLTDDNHRALYVPEGCGHAFLTLADDTEVFYQMSQFYEPTAGRGLRWNDPSLDVHWPHPVRVISERDRTYPDLQRVLEENAL